MAATATSRNPSRHPDRHPAAIAAVAIGGTIGAGVRWACLRSLDPGAIPWPVLGVNVVGSFVLGLLIGAGDRAPVATPGAGRLLHILGVGFCGGLTTFSTFAVEVVALGRSGHPVEAGSYVVMSLLGTVAACLAGSRTRRAST